MASQEKNKPDAQGTAAFKDKRKPGPEESDVQIRPAGREQTRDPAKKWDEVDEASDESFPASDAPARY